MTGNLEGRVLDLQGEPLPGVTVTIAGPNLQGVRGAASNENGHFRVRALPVGAYTVRISRLGSQPLRLEHVAIRLGRTTTLAEVRLEAQAVELPEIVVSGERPLIDPTSAAIGTNLLPETFSTLPVERNFRSLAALAPQANASFFPDDEANIAGGSGAENMYYVDGINVTDPMCGETSTNLPYNFVKEIEIKSGGYEAEYGRALGGIVNVVTYSGGNEFHGQVFGFFTNQGLAGASRRGMVAEKVGDFSQYDIGFSLGGPVKRDRLWFFLAHNPTFEDREIEIPGVGFRIDRRRSHLFAGKLTWQAGPNTDFVFTMLGDPSIRHRIGEAIPFLGVTPTGFANPDPVLGVVEEGGINLSLKGRHRPGSHVLLEASAARFARKQNLHAETDRGSAEPVVIDLTTGMWSGGYGAFQKDYSVRTSVTASASVFLGNHALKAGLEYEDNLLDDYWGGGGREFGGGGFLFRASDTSYSWFLLGSAGRVHNRVPSVYVRDSWLATERLRLNAGLRWDGQFFVGADGKVAQKITNQFQPRVGITYQPGERDAQKLFASYGRFYEQLGTNLSSFYHSRGENTFVDYNHNPLVDRSGGDTTSSTINGIAPEVPGLQGEHFDEFILGYEQRVWSELKMGVRGIYRTLREVIDDASDPSGNFVVGNPGRGALSYLGPPKRDYTALEITVEKSGSEPFNFLASYVLSRNYGNYTGVYSAELQVAGNAGPQYDIPELIPNNTGLLPNDRTHLFKFFGSYRFSSRLTAGAFATWQSGTPLSELGGTSVGLPYSSFLRARGSAGRTPAIWDLNLRLSHDLGDLLGPTLSPKVLLDVFHIGNPRKAVAFDQVHYGALDAEGNQTGLNPNYGRAKLYQPPTSLRLGMQIDF